MLTRRNSVRVFTAIDRVLGLSNTFAGNGATDVQRVRGISGAAVNFVAAGVEAVELAAWEGELLSAALSFPMAVLL